MRGRASFVLAAAVGLVVASSAGPVAAAGNPMTLVGSLNPWKDGQFSNVAASDARHD